MSRLFTARDIDIFKKCVRHGVYVGKSCPIPGCDAERQPELIQPEKGEETAAQRKYGAKLEAELQDAILTDLRRRGIFFIHARRDKPSTIRKGCPDITAIKGRLACCIECKTPTGRLSQDQIECIAELRAAGTPVLVTTDLAEAINFIRENLEAHE